MCDLNPLRIHHPKHVRMSERSMRGSTRISEGRCEFNLGQKDQMLMIRGRSVEFGCGTSIWSRIESKLHDELDSLL
jgi:hypothetical protein